MKALFVHIPKTGGSSVTQALKCYGLRAFHDPKEYSAFDNDGMVTFGHASIGSLLDTGVMSRGFFDDAYKFCFVRNPFEGVVSSYHAMWYYTKDIGSITSPRGHSLSFPDFCRMLRDEGVDLIGAYNVQKLSQLNSQSAWMRLSDGTEFLDYIGRFEHLYDDFAVICTKLGLEDACLEHVQKSDVTERRMAKDKQYRDLYDDEARWIIGKLYEEDFDTFGYTF